MSYANQEETETDWDRINHYCLRDCRNYKHVAGKCDKYPDIVIFDNLEIWFYFDSEGKLDNIRAQD